MKLSAKSVFLTACLSAQTVFPMPVLAQTKVGTSDQACALLKERMAVHDRIPHDAVNKTWFCDVTSDPDNDHPEWWVIGLRSFRQCDGICSNLRGWFAVNRENAEIREWDMADFAIGDSIGKP